MRILYLTHRLPYAPNRGDRIRSYYMLREMSRFADVSVLSFVHDDEEAARASEQPFASHTRTVRVTKPRNLLRCVRAMPTSRPLTHVLLDAPDLLARLQDEVDRSRPDLVVAYCSGMARLALESPLRRLPFMLDMVDVDSLKWRRMAALYAPPQRWVYAREARTLANFELSVATQAAATIVVNDQEKDALERIAPTACVSVVPNGVELDSFRPPSGPTDSATVIFCGVMNYGPNESAVRWFAQQVWPRVRAARPEAHFQIVGAQPSRAVSQLASDGTGIEVVGAVPQVQPYLWNAAVSIAPLHATQGLQNKVLEALAAGLPVVTTSAVANGLPAAALPACDVTDAPERFAESVIRQLASTPQARRSRANTAVMSSLAWSNALSKLETIVRTVVTPRGAVNGHRLGV